MNYLIFGLTGFSTNQKHVAVGAAGLREVLEVRALALGQVRSWVMTLQSYNTTLTESYVTESVRWLVTIEYFNSETDRTSLVGGKRLEDFNGRQ